MFKRAIDFRDSLNVLIGQEPELEPNQLIYDDWAHLGQLITFLKPYRETTHAKEGLYDTIDRVLPGIEFILGHHKGMRPVYKLNPFMQHRIESSWAKLDKYYSKSDDTIAYIAATVLNLRWKWRWFELKWTTDRLLVLLRDSKRRLRSFRLDKYRHVQPEAAPPLSIWNHSGDEHSFASFLDLNHDDDAAFDELDLYIREPRIQIRTDKEKSEFRALDCWREPTQLRRFPTLSRIAFDLLTVPAMSAKAERVFPECSLASGNDRHRMAPETLEQLQQLKSWLRNAARKEEQRVSYASKHHGHYPD